MSTSSKLKNKRKAYKRQMTPEKWAERHGVGYHDPRKVKRELRTLGQIDHVYDAWIFGQEAGCTGMAADKNPYPKGRRHDEWERGRELCINA